MAKPKSDDSINFDSVIKNLSSDTKASDTPWFKKKSSIIAMSSTLGVGALVTVIAVPIALTSGTSSGNQPGGDINKPDPVLPPSTPAEKAAAIAGFNTLGVTDKIAKYNDFVAKNSDAIVEHIKWAGMGKFYDANVHQPISTIDAPNTSAAITNFQNFRNRLNTTSVFPDGPYTVKGKSTLLSIKGVLNKQTDQQVGPGLGGTNFGSQSYYITALDVDIQSPTFMLYDFISPAKESITNVRLNDDYTINMTLTDQSKNISFYLQTANGVTQKSLYKTNLTFNNETLFPGMRNKFATDVLGLRL